MNREEEEMIQAVLATVDRFTVSELAGGTPERDRYPYAEFSRKALQGAVDAGLLLAGVPEAFGGTGLGPSIWARILERVALEDAGFAAALLAHAMASNAVLAHAGEEGIRAALETAPLAYPIYHQAGEQDQLPRVKGGKGRTTRLEGRSVMAANAPVADMAVIVALQGDVPCLCLVRLSGASRPQPTEVLGLRSCPVGDILLDKVDPGEISILAAGDDAVRSLHGSFYTSAAAILLATLKASLDYAIAYGMDRVQGGKIIAQHSQLRSMYAQMEVEHLSLRLAWERAQEPGVDEDARLALKILAAEHAVRATIDGVQLLGGYGYTREYPQERRMRDARQASQLLGSPARQRLALIDGRLGPGDTVSVCRWPSFQANT